MKEENDEPAEKDGMDDGLWAEILK